MQKDYKKEKNQVSIYLVLFLYSKATQDSSSQTITSTYIKGLSVSGRTITYTRGDNTTGTITTQDTNTTYSVGTSTYSGTTKLYSTTGSNTDGTMTQKAIKEALDGKFQIITTDNKDVLSITMPFSGYAIIEFTREGWGYDGKPWEFVVSEKSNLLSTSTILEYAYWDDGTNKIKHPLRARTIFYNMVKGVTYNFIRNTTLGAIGGRERERFTGYLFSS